MALLDGISETLRAALPKKDPAPNRSTGTITPKKHLKDKGGKSMCKREDGSLKDNPAECDCKDCLKGKLSSIKGGKDNKGEIDEGFDFGSI